MKKEFYKTSEEIEYWLNKYEINNYKLIKDEKYGFVVDVINNVYLIHCGLVFIPIKFNKIIGALFCSGNNLTSLEFCPEKVGGDFYCNDNINLGDFQKENDFKKFYQAHKDFVSQFEYGKLNSIIKDNKSIKKNKI